MNTERKYFHINESSARTAHNMMSMRDYSEGSTTAGYRSEVDKAYRMSEKPDRIKFSTERHIPRYLQDGTAHENAGL